MQYIYKIKLSDGRVATKFSDSLAGAEDCAITFYLNDMENGSTAEIKRKGNSRTLSVITKDVNAKHHAHHGFRFTA